jgi:hypothetical protein
MVSSELFQEYRTCFLLELRLMVKKSILWENKVHDMSHLFLTQLIEFDGVVDFEYDICKETTIKLNQFLWKK